MQNKHFTLQISILGVCNFTYVLFWIQTFAGTLISCTSELKCEKRKSDHLLFQMLPPPVVKQLKQQRQVNWVTQQYFGFTTIYLKMKCSFLKNLHCFLFLRFKVCSTWGQEMRHLFTYIHTYIHMYIHTYIHTYVHTYIHTYIHTHIHTYVRT